MVKLSCFTAKTTDGCAFYRSVGPLSKMKDIDVIYNPTVAWDSLASVDIVFLQRPFRPIDFKTVKLAKQMNKKVWIDFDDDLFSVPPANPCYQGYSDQTVQDRIAQMTQMADVVSVSTQDLAESINKKLNNNVWVIPNAIDDEIQAKYLGQNKPRNNIIVWRGSRSHDADLMEYMQSISEFANRSDYQFVFIGDPFWCAAQSIYNAKVVHALDVTEYFAFLYNLAPKAVIVPLVDDKFNRSKSNIAWIEATMAGAECIATKLPQFDMPGVFDIKDIYSYEFNGRNVEASEKYIKATLKLSKVNAKRYCLIKSLTTSG